MVAVATLRNILSPVCKECDVVPHTPQDGYLQVDSGIQLEVNVSHDFNKKWIEK